ncbi:protein NBR1 homolog [Argentina anserina]|uniref:protein NBR1 homolog n=1 Tax=Argentina anserina TaxID=57926 RepID=UPI0021768DB6|nr:protein NBR1 homolog [Potentilla anserina]
MVIKVRYFGTSKIRVGDRERYLQVRIDKNGQLGFDIGGLRGKICSTCYLPPGSDISLVYIDEDGDVVTLVDDDDLQEAMRQRLKSFRIDVLLNDNKVYRKSSSKRNTTRVMVDPVASSLGTRDDNIETNTANIPVVMHFFIMVLQVAILSMNAPSLQMS